MDKLGSGLFIAGVMLSLKTCVFAAAEIYQWPLFLGIGLMVSGVIAHNYLKEH